MKFASIDTEVAKVRQHLQKQKQKQDQNTKAIFDRLAFDIKNKATDTESNFRPRAQGLWVELIGKEVQKHAGAFTSPAG